jgi:cell division protein FtsI (penicillin-binding protein 3)
MARDTARRPRPRKRVKSSDGGRHTALLLAFLVLFGVIAVRLVWIQGVRSKDYAAAAESQRMKNIELSPRRGTIYDREGEPLAVSIESKTIFVSPRQIDDKVGTARQLARVLGGSARDYYSKIATDSGFAYLARKVDLAQARELEDLKLKGVGFEDDFKRMYPAGDLACQTLGFVGVDDSGLAGIELEYDSILAGKPGFIIGERDPKMRPIPGGVQKVIDPVHGHDIVLTIDKDIQYQSQVALNKAVKQYKAKSGSVIVMDPRSGEILAVASYPGYNPNLYGKACASAIRNKPITDSYEPGSTLKCLTAAAAIEQGLFTPDSVLDLPPTLRVGDRVIHESHGRGAVRWSLTDIVTESSNVGTVKIGLKLGEDGLYDSFSAFGLTEKPGVDFPGQAMGWLPPTDQWSASSIGNIPFGQGVSVTPMQLARAIGALANKGIMTTPHLLRAVPQSPDAEVVWPTRRAVSASTASQMTTMLTDVVKRGTGTAAAVKGFTVAGKTGTAQKARAGSRGYAEGSYVGSFIGYLPAEDPRLLICVTIDEPRAGYYGGTCAAPTFSKLAEFSVTHLKITAPKKHKAGKRVSAAKRSSVSTVSGSGKRD